MLLKYQVGLFREDFETDARGTAADRSSEVKMFVVIDDTRIGRGC